MLLKDRLRQLFASYEPDVQRVINEVLDLEQQYISYPKPRVKDEVDEIVSRVAEKRAVPPTQTRATE